MGLQPAFGLHTELPTPGKVQRRTLSRPVYKRRVCRDNRAYVLIPFTFQGELVVGNSETQWAVDRDYWVARLSAEVGRHDEDFHPNDGTPSGTDILINMRVVSADSSTDVQLLTSDGRLRIEENHHQDSVTNGDDGAWESNDFNVKRLAEGEHIYPRISQVGSVRPGTGGVVTAVLVPIP